MKATGERLRVGLAKERSGGLEERLVSPEELLTLEIQGASGGYGLAAAVENTRKRKVCHCRVWRSQRRLRFAAAGLGDAGRGRDYRRRCPETGTERTWGRASERTGLPLLDSEIDTKGALISCPDVDRSCGRRKDVGAPPLNLGTSGGRSPVTGGLETPAFECPGWSYLGQIFGRNWFVVEGQSKEATGESYVAAMIGEFWSEVEVCRNQRPTLESLVAGEGGRNV
ncbi:hypothetical protein MLD38_009612 [Melastoma candidum]|uniref:Uncharacterized protein n=1 Tax=Melastoma candidum TaxID=119954 RepID=A0ACB9RY18_9MYRT|nr:hypothetical protein MLD38_009612 [Melastoma candidum]